MLFTRALMIQQRPQKSNRQITCNAASQWGPKVEIDRKSEHLIRAAGDGESIDSASSNNPIGGTLQPFRGSRVTGKAPAVSGGPEFHSTQEAQFTTSKSSAQWCERHVIYRHNEGNLPSPVKATHPFNAGQTEDSVWSLLITRYYLN